MNRTRILMGRIHKLENFQAKMSNLMNGIVFGGELPAHVKEGLKTPEIRSKIKAKIDKAERIKFKIALAVYDDIIS